MSNVSNAKKKADDKLTPNEQALCDGIRIIKEHKLFGRLKISVKIADKNVLANGTAALSLQSGDVLTNSHERYSPGEWAFMIAHCMLHLCFGHFDSKNMPGYYTDTKDGKVWTEKCDRRLWNMACDIYITKFLSDIKFGTPVCEISDRTLLSSSERGVYDILAQRGLNAEENPYGTARKGDADMVYNGRHYYAQRSIPAEFAYAVSDSVRGVINEAGGLYENKKRSVQELAAEWFINHYPLLGALAAGFKIKEVGYGSGADDVNDVSIAAVSTYDREIYVNSSAGLSMEEWKFVLAHEYLHAGLMHTERCAGRDHHLWNVACDFVINGWLCQMNIGSMPTMGLLYDETLKDLSAEEIYDILIKDLKKNSKLATFRGYGKGDILDEGYAASVQKPTTLDDFCKNALRSGLEYHRSEGRGFIPAGLIEEIKALSVPPVPWSVELAQWFDINFSPIERRRTYARPSRRQSSTPYIPRPSLKADIPEYSRTYAVIIDTSGSMSARMIGMALGAAASYSIAKDVPLVRVVFCDAKAYDIGYVTPDDIAGRVEVKGRGGTVIQPAVELLEKAEDFPAEGPILIITDGYIEDRLEIHREHAFLVPKGHRLPFTPKGKVFYSDDT